MHNLRTFLVVQLLRFCPLELCPPKMQGMQVQSLVQKLRSHMLFGMAIFFFLMQNLKPHPKPTTTEFAF